MTELRIATASTVRSRPPTISAPTRPDSVGLLVRSVIRRITRRRPDSNWGIRLLQSPALPLGYVAGWSGWRESNPRVNLGKVAGYHYITPARCEASAFGDG